MRLSYFVGLLLLGLFFMNFSYAQELIYKSQEKGNNIAIFENRNDTIIKSGKLTYCIPLNSANNSDEILNFSLSNIYHSSSPSEGNNGYMDYTSTVAPAYLIVGYSYNATIYSGEGSGNHGAAIWIDFNDDGVFDNSELVSFIDNTITPLQTVSFPAFLVPNSPGVHRLRIQYRYNATTEFDPCNTITMYAETEDYLVYVFTNTCTYTTAPYQIDFETLGGNNLPECTSVQNASFGNNWVVNDDPGFGFTNKALVYKYNSNEPADAWFFTRAIYLYSNYNYKLSFKYGNNSQQYTEKLKVFMGTYPSFEGMENPIIDLPEISIAGNSIAEVYFSPNVSGIYFLGFNCYSDADQFFLFLDDIAVEYASDCYAPSSIGVIELSTNSAIINWNYCYLAESYEIYYSEQPVTPYGNTQPNGSSSFSEFTLSNLEENTNYYVWVRSKCGGNVYSSWSNMFSFKTYCDVTTLPYFEDFESVTIPNMPECTSIENAGVGNNWITYYNPVYQTTELLYAYNYNFPANAWFYTQSFNLEIGSYYKLSFKYHVIDESYPESLRVAIGTSNHYYSMNQELVSMIDFTNQTPLVSETVFTPYTSGKYYIGFNCISDANQYHLYVDDIAVVKLPSPCMPPLNLNVISYDSNNVTLLWEHNVPNNSLSYDIYYSTSSVAPDMSTTPVISVLGNITSLVIGGLSESTTYYVWIRSKCDTDNYSEWSDYVSFTTLCNPVSVPYSLDFETVIIPNMPECVIAKNNGIANNWETVFNPGFGFTDNAICYKTDLIHPANAWFFTRGIQLSEGIIYRISFKYGNSSNNAVEKLLVYYGSTPFDNNSNIYLANLCNITGAQQEEFSSEFTVTQSGVYYFKFNCYSNYNQSYLFIDDISIDEANGCIAPINLSVSNVTANSATLTWQEPNLYLPIFYEIYYNKVLSYPTSSTIPNLIVDSDANNVELHDLSPNSNYYVWIRSACDQLEKSVWQFISFSTLCNKISVFPYSQKFNSNDIFPPDCWIVNSQNQFGTWHHNPQNGGYAEVLFNFNQDEWLISQTFDFSNVKKPKLSFDWMMSYDFAVGTNDVYDLNCKISTDGGLTWTLLWNETDFGIFNSFNWNNTIIDLSNYVGEESVNIAWQYIGDNGAKAGIDNVLISTEQYNGASIGFNVAEFDLDNPSDIVVNIIWNDANSINSIIDNQNTPYSLVTNQDFTVNNDTLIIKSSYLETVLINNNDFILLNLNFNIGSAKLVVNAIKNSINKLHNTDISIYPNPSNGKFLIDINNNYKIVITDIAGRIIYTDSLQIGHNIINLSGQAIGLYMISFVGEEHKYTYRIIIE